MATATQLADLDRLLRKLNPSGDENDELITLLNSLFSSDEETTEALAGSEVVITTADMDINNTETLADVPGLETISLDIGRKYLVELIAIVEAASVTPDIDLKFVGSANTTLEWGVGGLDGSALESTIATEKTVALATGIQLVKAEGILDIVDTAGTLKLQAAQNVATAEDTSIKTGSILKITRVE